MLSAVYFLATTVHGAFTNVINVTGFLFSIFYVFTAFAAMTYYRRRITSNPWDFVVIGILPLGAAGHGASVLGCADGQARGDVESII